MTSPRVQTISTGVTKQMLPAQLHVFIDPTSGSIQINFQGQPYLYVQGALNGVAGGLEMVSRNVTDVATQCPGTGADPTTGADLTKISIGGAIAVLVNGAFGAIWDEQVAAEEAAAAAAAEAQAAADEVAASETQVAQKAIADEAAAQAAAAASAQTEQAEPAAAKA